MILPWINQFEEFGNREFRKNERGLVSKDTTQKPVATRQKWPPSLKPNLSVRNLG